MERIRISAISYLNTAPFVYGLKQSKLLPYVDLAFDTPSVCAARLRRKEADLGIVPVAALPDIADARTVSDFCIGADGPVRTVVVCAAVPIEQIGVLYLDPDSRTSALLAQLLLRRHWKAAPAVLPLEGGVSVDPLRKDAGYLLIGDKVFDYVARFPHVYDLAAEWKAFRGMPFVFATWTAVRDLSADFTEAFNRALSYGVKHVGESVRAHSPLVVDERTAVDYLLKNISYDFDQRKRRALGEFLDLVAADDGWIRGPV